MFRLKYLVAACVLAITVGAANATTFAVTGSSGLGVDHTVGCPNLEDPCNYSWGSVSLSGTVNATGGILTGMNISVVAGPDYSFQYIIPTVCPGCLFIFGLSPAGLGVGGSEHLTIYFTDLSIAPFDLTSGGQFSFRYHWFETNPFGVDVEWFGSGALTPLPSVPLPTTLPLFATGLGALGLLGWRRKRKNAAAVAA